ncbi:MAG: L-arabinose isomerase family protein, partial [Planctomycetota bacterium]
SAHGGREFGFMVSRMRRNRRVIVGHWQEQRVQAELGQWMRAARGWQVSQELKVARFGDNMRQVAVTEGDKVAAQLRFGWQVDGYGVGDLVDVVNAIAENEIDALIDEYRDSYQVAAELLPDGARYANLREQARYELGIQRFLDAGGYQAFTTTFEDLHGLAQLPGLACQRLMAKGYGFGAEGDWKTAAMLRVAKAMADQLPGGNSFMEDYTYHMAPESPLVLGAHMLEVCPSIAAGRPRLAVHELGIGGKQAPPRLIFQAPAGPAVNASLIDVGNRFRLVVNAVEVVPEPEPLPHLPVARACWRPLPDFAAAATCWIQAGAAHHSVFSQALQAEHFQDFASIADIEYLPIDADTRCREFLNEIRWNDCAYAFGVSH